MKETIYTIPINEAFEKKCGCALCTLYGDLEQKSLEYITGAAMMEPSVRIETNRLGFCAKHFEDMLKLQNRLSVALMLESHLDELKKRCFDCGVLNIGTDPGSSAAEAAGSCFVCARISTFMDHYYENLLYMWKTGIEFRQLFAAQPVICLPHLAQLLERAKKSLPKKEAKEFTGAALLVAREHLASLRRDIGTFTKSFDYRNSAAELTEDEKRSVERTIGFLTSFYNKQ